MSLCKTLPFCKTRLLSPVGRHVFKKTQVMSSVLQKDMTCVLLQTCLQTGDRMTCLRRCLNRFHFLLFLLLKTCLLPRHVLHLTPRHNFYSEVTTDLYQYFLCCRRLLNELCLIRCIHILIRKKC